MHINLVDVNKSFDGNQVLNSISVEILSGKITGLIGPSEGGKTVLLKILGNILLADSGARQVSEDAKISIMFQEGALFDSITVLDNVTFPLTGGKVPVSIIEIEKRKEICEEGLKALAAVGLEDASHKYPAQLSGGMRRRLSLARALISKPDIILLDDPTAGLDPVASSVIMNLIVEMQRKHQMTCLLVSHDLRRLLPRCDKIVALFYGRIFFNDSLETLKSSKNAELIEFVQARYNLSQ